MLDAEHDGSTAQRPAAPGTVLAFGLDSFHRLRDLFGTELADSAIEHVRQRLQDHFDVAAAAAQRVDDHVIVRLPRLGARVATAMAEDAQEILAGNLIQTEIGPIAITASVGIAQQDHDCDGVYERAVHALRSAKTSGVGALLSENAAPDLDSYRRRVAAVSRATVAAASEDRLALAYQPIVRASGTDVISFHECLVRLLDTDGNIVPAAEFLPVVSELGLTPFIDRQVLMLAFATLVRHPTIRLSINICPETMQDRLWLTSFEHAAASDPMLSERLIVEVTETTAMLDPERTQTFMDRLRVHGVTFALDDFGAGHTSLRHLRDFRFDILKIDGYLIRDIDRQSDNAFIVEMLAALASRFEMMTVAEAVQSPAEARALTDLGIDYFQGFQFGSPSLQLKPTPTPMPMVAAQA